MSEGAGIPSSMPNNQCVNAAQRVSRRFTSMKAEITSMRQEVTELESERV